MKGRKIHAMSLLLCLALLLTVVLVGITPAQAATSSGTCGTNVNWTLDSAGTLTISGSGNMTSYSDSPDVPWYSSRSSVKKVVIDNGVTSIADSAFGECTNLASVVIPGSVTNIGDFAFWQCEALTSVTIPDGVTSIGYVAFARCTSLTSVFISGSVTSIGESAFEYCSNLADITIADGVTSISANAFHGCSSLSGVTIPDSVTSIGADAFLGCTSAIVVSNSVSYVDDWAVDCKTSVTTVLLRKDTQGVANSAFYDCNSLTSVSIPESVRVIGSDAFWHCQSLSNVAFMGTTPPQIGQNAFYNVYSTVYYPGGELWTGELLADYGGTLTWQIGLVCGSDLRWSLTDGVLKLSGTGSMWNYSAAEPAPWYNSCDEIHSLVLPAGITQIGSYAFYKCTGLELVTVPSTVTSIGASAFRGCSSLSTIVFASASPPSIGSNLFTDVPAVTAYYPYSSSNPWTEAVQASFGSNLTWYCGGICGNNVFWSYASNTLTISGVGSMYNYSSSSISSVPWYSCRSKIKTAVIEYGVSSIGAYAFAGCGSMTKLQMPDSVSVIQSNAFNSCSGLSGTLSLPESVTVLGRSAFAYCSGLTQVVIPNRMTSIGAYAFQYCTSLATVLFAPLEPPTIENNAFYQTARTVYAYYPATGSWTSSVQLKYGGSLYWYARRMCGDNLTWALADGILTVSGTGTMWDFEGGTAPWLESSADIQSVVINDGVTSVGAYAFAGYTALTSVSLPESLTGIDTYAFYACSGLARIELPDAVSTIGQEAFYQCTGLTELTLPNSLLYIGAGAFSCTGLTELTLPDSLVSIDVGAFVNCTSLLYVHAGGCTAPLSAGQFGGCSSLLSFSVSAENPNYRTSDGVLMNGDGTALMIFPSGRTGEYHIPEGVTEISGMAFHGSHLSALVIPSSVTLIGYNAIDCSSQLSSVTFESTVPPSIHEDAFYGTSAIVYYPASALWTQEVRQNYGGTLIWVAESEFPVFLPEGFTGSTAVESGSSYRFSAGDCSFCTLSVTMGGLSVSFTEHGDGSYTVDNVTGNLVITTADHSWCDWVTVLQPACISEGLQARMCSACRAAETAAVPAVGHSYNAVVTAPTCTDRGYTTHTCVACGDTIISDYTDPLGGEHIWSAWIQITAPTCTADGTQLRFCNCGAKEHAAVSALGHSYESGVCTACGATATPAIASASLTLDSILRLNITVDTAGYDASALSLAVTVGSEAQSLSGGVFEILLPAHRLYENVTIELLYSGQVIDTELWTFEAYSAALRADHAEDARMMALLDALRDYAAYAAYFADPSGAAVNSDAVEAVTKDALAAYQQQLLINDSVALKPSAALYLDDACDIRIKFSADAWNGHTLLINGASAQVSITGQHAVFEITGLTPQQWDDVYSIQVLDADGTTVLELEYCVLSYAYAGLSSSQELQTGLNSLLKAMYLYSQAADAYLAK